jgi:hypothetical protein
MQFQRIKTLYGPDGGAHWSKTKDEAVASWSTPLGPGRYRIWREWSWRADLGYTVVRLTPSAGTFNGKPRKFSGYSLTKHGVRTKAEAIAIAEADNIRQQHERSTSHG